MIKPKSLRKALTEAVPMLRHNPDMLKMYLDRGNIVATLAHSLSFENRYTLNLIITDFTGDLDLLLVPINAWLRVNQPDIMATADGQNKGFTYFADINNDDSCDISINLQLSERTLVSEIDQALHVSHVPETSLPEPIAPPVQLYLNGKLESEWHGHIETF